MAMSCRLSLLCLLTQAKSQVFFGGRGSGQGQNSFASSNSLLDKNTPVNNFLDFVVENREQKFESSKRHGCCLWAAAICRTPCAGRDCSSHCTVKCGFLGTTCPALSCSVAAPTTCTSTPTTPAPTTTTSTTTTLAPITSPCPTGYTLASATKCWQVAPAPADWLDALTSCVQQGGTLATVETQQQQDVLASLLGPEGAWIGLSDILNEGTFTWRDDSPLLYTNWKTNGQPNNANGNQHCVQARPDWDDTVCGKVQPYVCQLQAQISAPRRFG